MLDALHAEDDDYKMILGITAAFERELPNDAKQPSGTQYKTLDLTTYHDCKAARSLKDLMCSISELRKECNLTEEFHGPDPETGEGVAYDIVFS